MPYGDESLEPPFREDPAEQPLALLERGAVEPLELRELALEAEDFGPVSLLGSADANRGIGRIRR
jgi:hypothetical protein